MTVSFMWSCWFWVPRQWRPNSLLVDITWGRPHQPVRTVEFGLSWKENEKQPNSIWTFRTTCQCWLAFELWHVLLTHAIGSSRLPSTHHLSSTSTAHRTTWEWCKKQTIIKVDMKQTFVFSSLLWELIGPRAWH